MSNIPQNLKRPEKKERNVTFSKLKTKPVNRNYH